MIAAAVTAASVAAFMIVSVVVAVNIRVITQCSVQIFFNRRICIAGASAEYLNTCLLEGKLRPAANASAYKHFNAAVEQKAGKRAVPCAVGSYYLGRGNFAVLHFIYLEVFAVSEVLKNFSVLVGYCNFHSVISV